MKATHAFNEPVAIATMSSERQDTIRPMRHAARIRGTTSMPNTRTSDVTTAPFSVAWHAPGDRGRARAGTMNQPQKRVDRKRLVENSERPELPHAGRVRRRGGENDDRNIPAGATQLAHDVPSGRIREIDIEKHNIEVAIGSGSNRGGGRGRLDHLEVAPGERSRQGLA